jgi:uncharacterized membrane protein YdjX (TVP38/TMEM64 family)
MPLRVYLSSFGFGFLLGESGFLPHTVVSVCGIVAVASLAFAFGRLLHRASVGSVYEREYQA